MPLFSFLFILSFLLPVMLYGQPVNIKPERGGAFFVGFSNRLVLTTESGNCDEITASADFGTLKKEKGCVYSFNVSTKGMVTITLKQKIKGNESVIARKQIAVKYIPPPEARIGRRKSGPFPLSAFKMQTGVGIVQEGWEGKPYFMIMSYDVIIYRNNSVVLSEHCNDAYFNDACKSFLKQGLRAGDKVVIEHLLCTCPDCRIQRLNNLSYVMI